MGRAAVVAVVVALILSGCARQEAEPGPATTDSAPVGGTIEEGPATAAAPLLRAGQAWTYETGGYWNQVPRLRIVVAQAAPSGFLLAAEQESMLEDEIAWDLPYLGLFDASFVPLRDEKYGGAPQSNPLLAFPLEAGKSWTYYDTLVTAEPANVSTPGGDVDGWRITGADAKRQVLVEYAPSVGFVTLYEERSAAGNVAWSLRLAGQEDSKDWTWFKRKAELVDVGAPKAPSTMAVTAQDDAVFAWATGSAGSRGLVAPPGKPPWAYEAAGGVGVRKAWFAAEPGTWSVSGIPSGPDGYVYTQLHAIEWIKPG